jgi:hypothetical protein
MDEADDRIGAERRLNLAETGDEAAGFAGKREGADGGGKKEIVNATTETRRDRRLALERLLQKMLLLGSVDRASLRRHPDAATGKTAAEIGDYAAVRCDDEPEKRIHRLRHASDDAGAFGGFVATGQGACFILT